MPLALLKSFQFLKLAYYIIDNSRSLFFRGKIARGATYEIINRNVKKVCELNQGISIGVGLAGFVVGNSALINSRSFRKKSGLPC